MTARVRWISTAVVVALAALAGALDGAGAGRGYVIAVFALATLAFGLQETLARRQRKREKNM